MSVDKDFEKASNTGREIFILFAKDQCDCYNPKDLVNSEPNPTCSKCFGTGKTRTNIKTEKVRYQIYNDGGNILENQDKNQTQYSDEKLVFFLPAKYINVSNEELFCTLKEGTIECDKLYRIVNIVPFFCEGFIFYEAYGEKINLAPEVIL